MHLNRRRFSRVFSALGFKAPSLAFSTGSFGYPFFISTLFFAVLIGCSHSPIEPSSASGPSAVPFTVDASVLGKELRFNPTAENRPGAGKEPYVVLVSIDGYRYDYNLLYHPTNLSEMASQGMTADALLPIYPSKTFPSHYTIVTGLYADHHGIVSNEFYDPTRKQLYALGDRAKVEDGTWYFGEPLWITASRQGLLSASCFWVGSEADIQKSHPNYYYRYDKSMSSLERTEKILTWLKLPAKVRPHFMTLYFDLVDLAGHQSGVDQKNLPEAIHTVDDAIGKLREGIRESHLPVNIVVVSDHGMEDLDSSKLIYIDEVFGVVPLMSKFQLVGRGPQMMLYLKPGEDRALIPEMLRRLRLVKNHFRAFARAEMQELHYSASDRVGDIVIVPDIPYLVGLKTGPPSTRGGNHGWDVSQDLPDSKNMRGVLFAEGPAFKPHSRLKIAESVDVFPMITQILNLENPKIDGRPEVTRRILKQWKSR